MLVLSKVSLRTLYSNLARALEGKADLIGHVCSCSPRVVLEHSTVTCRVLSKVSHRTLSGNLARALESKADWKSSTSLFWRRRRERRSLFVFIGHWKFWKTSTLR